MCSSEDIAHIREWAKKIKYFPQDVDDNYIRPFILSSGGSLQKAKKKYEGFHLLRHQVLRLGTSWDFNSEEIRALYNKMYAAWLPRKTPNGSIVLIAKCRTEEGTLARLTELMFTSLLHCILAALWYDEIGPASSVEVVFDYRLMKFDDFKLAGSADGLRLIAQFLKGSLPLRIAGTHDTFPPSYMVWMIKGVSALVSQKIRERRHIHTSLEELYEKIPREILPSEYGGDEVSLAELHERRMKLLKDRNFAERLLKERDQILSEKEFLPKAVQEELTDSFRQLEID